MRARWQAPRSNPESDRRGRMRQHASDSISLFLFGVIVTLFLGAATFRYFPTPLELFGDAGAECRQSAVSHQKEAPQGQNNPKGAPAVLKAVDAEPQAYDADTEKRINDCLIAKYTVNLAMFTKWLVIVTGLLAGFGLWQVIISRNAARRQLRAYVFLDPDKEFSFVRKPSTTATVEVEIHVKNLGTTPAHELFVESWMTVDAWPMPKEFAFVGPSGEGPVNHSVIPPGGVAHFHVGTARPFNAAELAAIEKGDLCLYIYGSIKYRDAFNRRHWTNFCQGSTALGKEGFRTAMAKCDRHNDADNN
jgi:hypothetical protein